VATLIDAAETLVAVEVTVLRNEDAIIPTEESTITTITTIVILKVAGASTTTTAAVLPGRPSRREIGETTVVIGERRETDLDLARQDEGNNKMLLDFICFNGASSSSRLSVKLFHLNTLLHKKEYTQHAYAATYAQIIIIIHTSSSYRKKCLLLHQNSYKIPSSIT
jgi:hypothetical protein